MGIYIFLLLLNIVFVFMPSKKIIIKKLFAKTRKTDADTIYTAILCVIMFMIMAFRGYSVGVDTFAYQNHYIKIATSSTLSESIIISSFTGPGYILICWLLHFISNNPRLYIIFSSAVINILIFNYVKCNFTNCLKYILLWQTSYMFAFSLNGNRQVLATLLQLNGICFLKNNIKDIRGWILVLIGISIHPISVMILILYLIGIWFSKRLSTVKVICIALLSGGIIHYGITIILELFFLFFPSYLKYMGSGIERGFFNTISGGKIIYFYLFVLVVMVYYGLSKIARDGENVVDLSYLYSTVTICTLGLLNSHNTTVSRFMMCVIPLGITLISRMNIMNKSSWSCISESIIHIIFIIYMILCLFDNQSGVIPYVID